MSVGAAEGDCIWFRAGRWRTTPARRVHRAERARRFIFVASGYFTQRGLCRLGLLNSLAFVTGCVVIGTTWRLFVGRHAGGGLRGVRVAGAGQKRSGRWARGGWGARIRPDTDVSGTGAGACCVDACGGLLDGLSCATPFLTAGRHARLGLGAGEDFGGLCAEAFERLEGLFEVRAGDFGAGGRRALRLGAGLARVPRWEGVGADLAFGDADEPECRPREVTGGLGGMQGVAFVFHGSVQAGDRLMDGGDGGFAGGALCRLVEEGQMGLEGGVGELREGGFEGNLEPAGGGENVAFGLYVCHQEGGLGGREGRRGRRQGWGLEGDHEQYPIGWIGWCQEVLVRFC